MKTAKPNPKKRTTPDGATLYLVHDRKGRPVWVSVPRK